jgi:parallel beta-helix repeat protein
MCFPQNEFSSMILKSAETWIKGVDMKKHFVPFLFLLSGFLLLACSLPGLGAAAAPEIAPTSFPQPENTPAVPDAPLPTSTPDMRPVTVQVNADGSGDYAALHEAVAAVPAGSTINLGAGVHTLPETLKIEKSLHIIGAGPQQTIIRGTVTDRNMIYVDVPGAFSFKNIALEYTSSNYGSCLGISAGQEIHIKNCRFSGAVRREETDGADGGVGLWVGGSTTGVVEDCEVDKNQSYGIELSNKAKVALINNHCHENAEDGIALFGESEGTLLYNLLERNGDNGVWIDDTASAEIANNTIKENIFDGIVLVNNSSAVIHDNTITKNDETGVWLEASAFAKVTNNTITGNKQDGILTLENASALIEGNMIYDNGRHGISIKDQCQPEIIGNSIKGNGEAGIIYWDTSGGTLMDNQVHNNKWGIYINAGANPQLSGNEATSNTDVDFVDKR